MITFKEYLEESELQKHFSNEHGDTWQLTHLGAVDGRDLGAGGDIDVFVGHNDPNDKSKKRYFIRGQRTGNLRGVPSDHKAVRRHFFPGKV